MGISYSTTISILRRLQQGNRRRR